jgi:hypothetical protein
MAEMVDDFKKKNKPAQGAMLPATPEQVVKDKNIV